MASSSSSSADTTAAAAAISVREDSPAAQADTMPEAPTAAAKVVSTASNRRRKVTDVADLPAPSEPLDEEERANGIICVRLTPKFQNRIFHEFDDAHPHDAGQGIGEALVVGKRVVKVAPTARVRRAIMERVLEEVRSAVAHPQMPDLIDLMNEKIQPGK